MEHVTLYPKKIPPLDEMNISEFSSFLREEISKEKMLLLDFSYISTDINNWWENENQSDDFFYLRLSLSIFSSNS